MLWGPWHLLAASCETRCVQYAWTYLRLIYGDRLQAADVLVGGWAEMGVKAPLREFASTSLAAPEAGRRNSREWLVQTDYPQPPHST